MKKYIIWPYRFQGKFSVKFEENLDVGLLCKKQSDLLNGKKYMVREKKNTLPTPNPPPTKFNG
jgi:hypothetical protein